MDLVGWLVWGGWVHIIYLEMKIIMLMRKIELVHYIHLLHNLILGNYNAHAICRNARDESVYLV